MSLPTQRFYNLDIIRLSATIAVIILHVAASMSSLNYSTSDWMAGNIYFSLTRWCVPVFIMLSGILLLDPSKEYSNKVFFSKRLARVALPFIGWSLIYQLRSFRGEILSNKSLPIWNILKGIWEGPVSVHLWFVYLLMVLYLITPLIKDYIKLKTQQELKHILMAWFAINFIDYFCMFILGINSELHQYLVTFEFTGYMLLGYYLYTYPITINWRLILIFLITLLVTILGNYLVHFKNLFFNEAFDNFLSPNIVIISAFVIILMGKIQLSDQNLDKPFKKYIIGFITYFNKISYGIYLAHILILSIFNTQLKSNSLNIIGIPVTPYLSIPIVSLMILSACILLVSILEKIPYLKKILV